MDFRDPDIYKTAAQIKKDFQLNDFRVEKITDVLLGGRHQKVQTEIGKYEFDNHPYCRDSKEHTCIYRASSEAGIYDAKGEFLVIFETTMLPKKGDKVIGTNPRPSGRKTAWLSPDGSVEGYVVEIEKSSFLLVNDAGQEIGWFSHFVPA